MNGIAMAYTQPERLAKERKELEDRIELLESILKQIKARVNDTTVLVNIDIEAKEIGREVRIYTEQGKAAGIGIRTLTKEVEATGLFSKTHASYKVKLNLKTILEANSG